MEIILEIVEKWGGQTAATTARSGLRTASPFYPGHIMDIPQMFGTMDTVATYANIEKIYRAMKKLINEKFPYVRYISHSSHWYEWAA